MKRKRTRNEDTLPDYEFLFNKDSDEGKAGTGILKWLIKNNFGRIIVSSFLYIIKACPLWITPMLTANIINQATNPTDNSIQIMILNTVILSLVVLQNIPSGTLWSIYNSKVYRTIGAGFRNTFVRKLQHLSMTYHKEIETGRLQSKFLRDIEAVETLLAHFLGSVVPNIICVIMSISISAVKSGTVTIFYLIVIPIMAVLVFSFKNKMRNNNKKYRKETEKMSAKLTTMIDMLPITKAHGLENEEIASIEKNILRQKDGGQILTRTNSYFGTSTWVISQVLGGICLLFTGYLAIKGKISIGDIVLYQSYFTSISGNVQNLINIWPDISKGLESVKSVSEVMLSDDIEDNRNKIKLRYVHGTVYFDNVYYKYPNADDYVIKDFNLHVESGECIAFVGSSGSGKSTIMNMIIGFMQATEGTISIDGKPIEYLNLSDYRHFISVVPQNSILFTGTIRENITYGLQNVDEKKLEEVIELANINEFIDDFPNGIDTVIGEHGDKLSGGQKQRICIARALIRDPKILILDEATSALDNISEYHVQKAIEHLIKGRTTFIVAHRLSTIRDADRIVVMDGGRCVEMGTYDELMNKKGKFYELKTLSDFNA